MEERGTAGEQGEDGSEEGIKSGGGILVTVIK